MLQYLQEQVKSADFLEWLTLPILASAIVISCDPVTSHGLSQIPDCFLIVRICGQQDLLDTVAMQN